jgi:hypothetical protein
MGLTTNYIPYRSGDRFYNSNTYYNATLDELKTSRIVAENNEL